MVPPKVSSNSAHAPSHAHVPHGHQIRNFIVDDEENLIVINWEQSSAPAATLALEADGTWDMEEQDMNGDGELPSYQTGLHQVRWPRLPKHAGKQWAIEP
jgi:hypothetical protein